MRIGEFAQIGGLDQGVICFAVSLFPWKLAGQMSPRADSHTVVVPAGPADFTRTSTRPNHTESEGKSALRFKRQQ